MEKLDLSHDLAKTKQANVILVQNDGQRSELTKEVVCEHFLDIMVNDTLAAKIVCTPEYLTELVVGRLMTEQIIRSADEIENLYLCEQGSRAKVFLKKEITLAPAVKAEPTCCTGNRIFVQNAAAEKQQPLPSAEWRDEWIFDLAEQFAKGTLLHSATKGTHSCYLSVKGEVIFAVEDIGRHNALDKAIGYALLNNIAMRDCILFTSGRVPTDMVQKVVAAGIPVLVSKAVPTDAAIELARRCRLTLICRAWRDSFEVYA